MNNAKNPDLVGKCLAEAMNFLYEERARHTEELRSLREEIKVRDARIVDLERTAQADELLLEEAEESIHITKREHEVLQCLRQCMQNKIIAYTLGISESTVKVHLRNLGRKLNATNRLGVLVNGAFCKPPHITPTAQETLVHIS